MLYESSQAFFCEPNKRITLMGMSNVGKTRLASLLPKKSWFHYSADYRLATAYLRDGIVDTLKMEMMKNSHLAMHLRDDAIRVDVNVEVSNLSVVSFYLGMLGSGLKGGLPLSQFSARQHRHRLAEVSAMRDVQEFIAKGWDIYGYSHFINDASGSLCELIDPDDDQDSVLASLIDQTMLVYIKADARHEARLAEDATKFPKPLYYRPEFLEQSVRDYLAETGLVSSDEIDPRLFVGWVFPRLLDARRPRYEKIARHGCVVTAQEAVGVRNEDDFVRLIGAAIDRRASSAATTVGTTRNDHTIVGAYGSRGA